MSDRVREVVRDAYAKASAAKLERAIADRKLAEKIDGLRQAIAALPLRPAGPNDYADWLRRYIERGGIPTNAYDYRMPREMTVALADCTIPDGACGALSFGVIAPAGITVKHEGWDHCEIYDEWDNPRHVPLYVDVAEILLAEEKQRDR